MSQRRALIASIIITLVLAFSAIGIRAAMTDQPTEDTAAKNALPLLVTGSDTTQGDDGTTDDDEWDDEDEDEDEDHEDQSYASSQDDNDDEDGSTSSKSEAWHEEDNDDD